jgi:hypothetical protein
MFTQVQEVAIQQLWGISLLDVTYKIFTNILAKYIEPYAEQPFGG